MPDLGRIFRVRKWDDHGANYTLFFGLGRKKPKRVVLMMCLGEYNVGDPITKTELLARLAMIGLESTGETHLEVSTAENP